MADHDNMPAYSIHRLAVVVLLPTFIVACRSPSERLGLSDDQGQSRAAILREVPLGTPITEARAKLQALGFRCLELKNETWAGFASGQRFDYTWCDIRDSGTSVYRRWQVALVPERGKLRDVFVSPANLTGP